MSKFICEQTVFDKMLAYIRPYAGWDVHDNNSYSYFFEWEDFHRVQFEKLIDSVCNIYHDRSFAFADLMVTFDPKSLKLYNQNFHQFPITEFSSPIDTHDYHDTLNKYLVVENYFSLEELKLRHTRNLSFQLDWTSEYIIFPSSMNKKWYIYGEWEMQMSRIVSSIPLDKYIADIGLAIIDSQQARNEIEAELSRRASLAITSKANTT